MPPRTSPAQHHEDPVHDERDFLQSLNTYLGTTTTNNLTNAVAWHQLGNGNYLFTKESIAAHQTEPDVERKPDLELATLALIAQISYNNCFIKPDGNWKGPKTGKFTVNFQDIKLSFLAEAPPGEGLEADFHHALQNLEHLTAMAEGSGTRQTPIDEGRIKFRHVLFKIKQDDTEDDEEWNIRNWPIDNPVAEEARSAITDTHDVVPLPAYNLDGNLISPIDYKSLLPGAIVRIAFNYCHWHIPRQDRPANTFVADISSIKILRPGHPENPLKRSTSKRDPFGPSGTRPPKKAKTTASRT